MINNPLDKHNIFENIPADPSDEIFQPLAGGRNVRIERIISRGHSSPDTGWYDQDHDEWVIVLRGSATIAFENHSDIDLGEGDYVNIPARRKHRVSRTSENPETIWLVVHY